MPPLWAARRGRFLLVVQRLLQKPLDISFLLDMCSAKWYNVVMQVFKYRARGLASLAQA